MCLHFKGLDTPVFSFVDKNGVTWYRANDVFRAFELDNNQVTRIVNSFVHPDDRTKSSLGNRGTSWCVNLAGVYQLAMKSHCKLAKDMQKSLFDSVYELETRALRNGLEGHILTSNNSLYKVN